MECGLEGEVVDGESTASPTPSPTTMSLETPTDDSTIFLPYVVGSVGFLLLILLFVGFCRRKTTTDDGKSSKDKGLEMTA